MPTGFGMCLYKFRESPQECSYRVGNSLECSATRTELLQCFLDRYGAKLSPDSGVSLIEELCHTIIEVETPEDWEEEI